jgi:hypothetical protein
MRIAWCLSSTTGTPPHYRSHVTTITVAAWREWPPIRQRVGIAIRVRFTHQSECYDRRPSGRPRAVRWQPRHRRVVWSGWRHRHERRRCCPRKPRDRALAGSGLRGPGSQVDDSGGSVACEGVNRSSHRAKSRPSIPSPSALFGKRFRHINHLWLAALGQGASRG